MAQAWTTQPDDRRLRIAVVADDAALLARADERLARLADISVVATLDSPHHAWRLAGQLPCDVWVTVLPPHVSPGRLRDLLSCGHIPFEPLVVLTERRVPVDIELPTGMWAPVVPLDSADDELRHHLRLAGVRTHLAAGRPCHWGTPGAA